jgi:hypothetical protein
MIGLKRDFVFDLTRDMGAPLKVCKVFKRLGLTGDFRAATFVTDENKRLAGGLRFKRGIGLDRDSGWLNNDARLVAGRRTSAVLIIRGVSSGVRSTHGGAV